MAVNSDGPLQYHNLEVDRQSFGGAAGMCTPFVGGAFNLCPDARLAFAALPAALRSSAFVLSRRSCNWPDALLPSFGRRRPSPPPSERSSSLSLSSSNSSSPQEERYFMSSRVMNASRPPSGFKEWNSPRASPSKPKSRNHLLKTGSGTARPRLAERQRYAFCMLPKVDSDHTLNRTRVPALSGSMSSSVMRPFLPGSSAHQMPAGCGKCRTLQASQKSL
mmetsp:Transcript_43012/g.98861  ORF Transcript_43012/g.98861 Transcript_43012/m.98861 type:complete len:220 (-) Transcript_43012:1380-2039(-)